MILQGYCIFVYLSISRISAVSWVFQMAVDLGGRHFNLHVLVFFLGGGGGGTGSFAGRYFINKICLCMPLGINTVVKYSPLPFW